MPDLGILLVHGIGEQPRGDTLVRFGEPIVRWLRRWKRGWTNSEDVRLERADTRGLFVRLRVEGSSDEVSKKQGAFEEPPHLEPAHFVASFQRVAGAQRALLARLQDENLHLLGSPRSASDRGQLFKGASGTGSPESSIRGEAGRRTWMVAESWWAPHFRRPQFGTFAGWLLSRGPWVIVSGPLEAIRNAPGFRKVLAFFPLLASLTLALLAQVVVSLIALLAAVPWPRLREALSGLLIKLTGTLGDSYVFTESDVQEAAAVEQVRRDLRWMEDEGCRTVVVMAHSQGTAVARQAIESSDRVPLFITFGQGLRRLEELRWMRDNWRGYFTALGFVLPVFAACVLLSFFPPPVLSQEVAYYARLALPTWPASLLLASLVSRLDYSQKLQLLGLGHRCRWVDFFASNDPVPGGPLAVPDVISKPIHNVASLLGDHTAYWNNRDQFVGPLLVEIDRIAGTQLFSESAVSLVERVGKTRPRRVLVLRLLRWACLLGGVLGAYGLREDLEELGGGLIGLVARGPFGDSVLGSSEQAIESFGPEAAFLALGAVCLGALVFGWYGLTKRLWSTWDNLAVRPLYQEISKDDLNEQRIVGIAVAVLGSAPLLFGVATLCLSLSEIGGIAWVMSYTSFFALAGFGALLLVSLSVIVPLFRFVRARLGR